MKAITKKAIEQGELVNYLAGFSGYGLPNPHADTPTDPTSVFQELIPLMNDEVGFQDKVMDSLIELSLDKIYGWMVLYYFWDLKSFEKNSGVEVLSPKFYEKIGNNLFANKISHIENKRWIGSMYRNGIWGEILVLNKNFFDRFGIWVIPESQL